MKIVLDMNLSPDWAQALASHGWEAVHWAAVGDPRATDRVIMEWARSQGYVVLTHDLDFGALLALTHAEGPSVVQVRTQDLLSSAIQALLVNSLRAYEKELNQGALLTVDEARARIRILPIRRS